jgi:hypothetical protein
MIVCFLGYLLAVSMFFTTFVHKIYVVLKMEKVYAHREFGLEANIIGCATYDLKTDKLTHQDLGQMQMYVNYYDRYVRQDFEKPTIGILLCESKKDSLVKLTLPEDANIYATQYQLYLPDKNLLQAKVKNWIKEYKEENPDEDE